MIPSCASKVVKFGSAYALRIDAAFAAAVPARGSFCVRVYSPEPPYPVFVPTLETHVRRFGKDVALPVPSALVTAGVLRHRQVVALALVPQKL
jgi:hypothetical protein